MAKKKKNQPREMETQEQKEARWAKNLKMARSMAKQAGLLKNRKEEKVKISEDY